MGQKSCKPVNVGKFYFNLSKNKGPGTEFFQNNLYMLPYHKYYCTYRHNLIMKQRENLKFKKIHTIITISVEVSFGIFCFKKSKAL